MVDTVDRFYRDLEAASGSLQRILEAPISPSDNTLAEALKALAELVVRECYVAVADKIIDSPRYSKIALYLPELYEAADALWEASLSGRVLVSGVELVRTEAPVATEALRVEAESFGLSPSAQAVFMGAGAFPATALYWAARFRCEVVCLEYNPIAAQLGALVVKAYGLEQLIRVICVDGARFDYSAATHIGLATLTRHKSAVIGQISRTMSRECLLTGRVRSQLSRCLSSGWDRADFIGLEEVGQVRSCPLYNSFFLVKS